MEKQKLKSLSSRIPDKINNKNMKYLSVKHIDSYLENKSYASIYANGSVKGMKKLFGWDKAKEIIKSGNYIYAIWNS